MISNGRAENKERTAQIEIEKDTCTCLSKYVLTSVDTDMVFETRIIEGKKCVVQVGERCNICGKPKGGAVAINPDR